MYINDLPDVVHSMVKLFADDAKVSAVVNSENDAKVVQRDLNNIDDWSDKCPCDTPFTIKHILLHCVDFQNSRDKYYKVNTLKELFETVEIHNIFDYLKEIGLFNKI